MTFLTVLCITHCDFSNLLVQVGEILIVYAILVLKCDEIGICLRFVYVSKSLVDVKWGLEYYSKVML